MIATSVFCHNLKRLHSAGIVIDTIRYDYKKDIVFNVFVDKVKWERSLRGEVGQIKDGCIVRMMIYAYKRK